MPSNGQILLVLISFDSALQLRKVCNVRLTPGWSAKSWIERMGKGWSLRTTGYYPASAWSDWEVEHVWNVMTHAQKPDLVFQGNGRIHLIGGGGSVQSTTGSRGVRISGNNAGYTMFWGSVKGTGYPLHSAVSPSLPLPCVTVCHHISTGLYDEIQVWVVTFSENTSKPERRDSAGTSGRVTTSPIFSSCRENISCQTQFTFTVLREVGFSYRRLWRGLFYVVRAARAGMGPREKKNPLPLPQARANGLKNL